VIQGKLTVGQLLTFNALPAYFLDPVKNLINLQPAMQTAIVASDRLGEYPFQPSRQPGSPTRLRVGVKGVPGSAI
jgi:ATP-binding cassette subfamily B protein